MLALEFTFENELEGIEERYDSLLKAKFNEIAELLHRKVLDNIETKFQKPTGALARTIMKEVDAESNPMTVIVGPSPESGKAWALEYGGKDFYTFGPTKAAALRFYWEKVGAVVFRASVNHPPSREYRYLRDALEEIRPEAMEMLGAVFEDLFK